MLKFLKVSKSPYRLFESESSGNLNPLTPSLKFRFITLHTTFHS